MWPKSAKRSQATTSDVAKQWPKVARTGRDVAKTGRSLPPDGQALPVGENASLFSPLFQSVLIKVQAGELEFNPLPFGVSRIPHQQSHALGNAPAEPGRPLWNHIAAQRDLARSLVARTVEVTWVREQR